MEAMKSLHISFCLFVVVLAVYYVYDIYFNNIQSEGSYALNVASFVNPQPHASEHHLEESEYTRKIKNVTLPKHYESLFYRADMKPAIREAVRGVCTSQFIYFY